MLQYPDRAFLNKSQLSDFLECDDKTIDGYVKEGVLPAPITRPKEKRPVWDKESAAVCMWILKNSHRFEKPVSSPDSSG